MLIYKRAQEGSCERKLMRSERLLNARERKPGHGTALGAHPHLSKYRDRHAVYYSYLCLAKRLVKRAYQG